MSEVFVILILSNVGLVTLLLYSYKDRVIAYYNKLKNQRKTRLETRVRRIVNEYLEELRND